MGTSQNPPFVGVPGLRKSQELSGEGVDGFGRPDVLKEEPSDEPFESSPPDDKMKKRRANNGTAAMKPTEPCEEPESISLPCAISIGDIYSEPNKVFGVKSSPNCVSPDSSIGSIVATSRPWKRL